MTVRREPTHPAGPVASFDVHDDRVRSRNETRSERSVIAFMAFLGVMLAFAVDVSLPAFDEIREEFDLGSGSGEVSLIITMYLLGIALGQLVWGPIADRYGRVPALLGGLGLYAIGALGATAAPSMDMLLGARLVWGLGAASPAMLRTTIPRDLYGADQMARVIAVTMAVFLIGPAFAPAVGEGLLLTGSWRFVFAATLLLCAVAAVWTIRFGETLDPAYRRPLEIRSTLRAFRVVGRTRFAVGHILAMSLMWGGFFTFLGSGQPIIDDIYDRGDWFAGYFALAALGMAASSLIASRVTERIGARKVVRIGLWMIIGLSAIHSVLALFTDGTPPFWIWLVLIIGSSSGSTIATPAFSALAMQPMARLAGTASAVMGVATTGGGAVLAAVVDRQVVDTVTPQPVGTLCYAVAAMALTVWASGGSSAPVDPD